jgi:NNP family nitrate/nitrite transporter-like MFS transporter
MKNLALATWAFAISFWAWNMIAPLGVRYATDLGLSSTEKSVLVAVPVLVGSVGRIIAGALTDKLGGRLMFPVLMVLTAPFVLLVAFAGNRDSYGLLLLFGFFLGIGGTTGAVLDGSPPRLAHSRPRSRAAVPPGDHPGRTGRAPLGPVSRLR